jgi:hypothetical protein
LTDEASARKFSGSSGQRNPCAPALAANANTNSNEAAIFSVMSDIIHHIQRNSSKVW